MNIRRLGSASQTPVPTAAQINAAAIKWCGEKERETFMSDILYFKNMWHSLPGLRAYVEREMSSPRTAAS